MICQKLLMFCGTKVSLDLKSDYSEEILSDLVDSRSLLENLIRNNNEYTGFLMWFSVFCMTEEVGRNTRLRLVFLPTLLSCSSRFLRAL